MYWAFRDSNINRILKLNLREKREKKIWSVLKWIYIMLNPLKVSFNWKFFIFKYAIALNGNIKRFQAMYQHFTRWSLISLLKIILENLWKNECACQSTPIQILNRISLFCEMSFWLQSACVYVCALFIWIDSFSFLYFVFFFSLEYLVENSFLYSRHEFDSLKCYTIPSYRLCE